MHCIALLCFACLVHCIVCGFDRDLQCLAGAGAGWCVVWGQAKAGARDLRGGGVSCVQWSSLSGSTRQDMAAFVCFTLLWLYLLLLASPKFARNTNGCVKKKEHGFCCNFFSVLVSLFHPSATVCLPVCVSDWSGQPLLSPLISDGAAVMK